MTAEDPKNNVRIGQPSNNSGSNTLERYRYQHTFTAILGLDMLSPDSEYERLICEYHEDVLAVLKNKKLVGIQIKTRDPVQGGFVPNDEPMRNTLNHFLELEKQYGNQFDSFQIVSNCGFKKGKNSFETLINNKIKSVKNTSLLKLIKWLKDEAGYNENIIELVFRKLVLIEGPGIHDIQNTLISHLSKISSDEFVLAFQLNDIAGQLINTIGIRSSNNEKDILRFLLTTLHGKPDKENFVINNKTITIDSIKKIISDYVVPPYIAVNLNTPIDTPKNSIALMKKKLSYGGIDPLVINNIEDWVLAADKHVLKILHGEENKELAKQKIEQIHSIVKRNAIQSFSRKKNTDNQFGRDMLHDLEDRLKNMPENEKKDVYHTPFDILRGITGRLTGQCEVQFSETPKGGFQ